MLNKRAAVLFVGLMLLAVTGLSAVKKSSYIQIKNQKFAKYPSWIFLPKNYKKEGAKWPLLVFLHGASYRDKGMEAVKRNVPLSDIKRDGNLPFIVVAPKCPSGKRWSSYYLKLLLNDVCAKYPVDEDRVYMTGMSLGGFGSWEFACRYPEYLAAIAPVCGGGKPDRAAAMKDVPVWAFHGDKDRTVSVRRTESMANALKKAGGNVKFTRMAGYGHNIGKKVYSKSELYDWLLEQRR